jgi:RNA polymerase sigma-70 factor (sigma-E family)
VQSKEQREDEFQSFDLAHRDRLRRYAYYLSGDWHQADDIVQKALTKLFAAWHRVEPGGAPAYARRIVTNVYLSHRRLAWVRRERATDEMPVQRIEAPQAEVELRLTVAGALDRLSARERVTIVLRYWEQLSVDETAAAMGCSAGTVKSQTSRAMGKLRRLLAGALVSAGA